MACAAALAALTPAEASAHTLVATEHRITSGASAGIYSTLPRLGADGVSRLVVYTVRPILGGGLLGNGVIYYQRLADDGAPSGAPVPVSIFPGNDAELNDVSGDWIVYTVFDSTTELSGRLFLYQISTGITRAIASAPAMNEGHICGDKLVWKTGASGSSNLMLFDLSWLETAWQPVEIAGPTSPIYSPDVGDRYAAYSFWTDQYDILAYDLTLGQTIAVTATPTVNETEPSTDGSWIIWVARDIGAPSTRVMASKMDGTVTLRTVADNGALSLRPSISGDLIAYESNLAGTLDVYVYRLSTGETFQVTATPNDEFLNDVHGNLVAYVARPDGVDDIFVSQLTFVSDDPVAEAGADLDVYTGDTAELRGTATDPQGLSIANWSWVVADAPEGSRWDLVASDLQTASFTPGTEGDYLLSLTVANTQGTSSAADYVTVHARDNLPPVAVATATATSGIVPFTVCFDGSQSSDPEGGPLVYDWQLGDGASGSTAAVCHTYQLPGQYTAALTVTDARNASDTELLGIQALPANRPPVVSPTASPNTGPAPLTVQFAAGAADADGDPLAYAWSFGDGEASAEASPSHVYAAAGTYVAWLEVSDGQASASASLTIAVSPSIELNVTRADIDFRSRRSQLAEVEVLAELYAAVPGPDDLVALHLDGAMVFAAPFARFEPVTRHGVEVPGLYKLRDRHVWVLLDFEQGRLAVKAEAVKLAGYEPSNGVDVEVMLGNAVAVDNIQPLDEKAERHYRHHRPERGRGSCHR